MQNIRCTDDLKSAIQLLEIENAINGDLLKKQIFNTYQSLKPVNLITSTMKDMASSPYLIENILGSVMGMTTGYLSKKIVVGASGGIVRNILGSMLQFGVTNAVARHPGSIISLGKSIFQSFISKKDHSDKEQSKQSEI